MNTLIVSQRLVEDSHQIREFSLEADTEDTKVIPNFFQ